MFCMASITQNDETMKENDVLIEDYSFPARSKHFALGENLKWRK